MVVSSNIPVLGQYTVTQEIGRNGYGIIYRAVDSTRSPVLIHAIAPHISNNENFIVRFELLRKLLPQVDDKYLLKILELGHDRGVYYLVKEWPSPDSEHLLTLDGYDVWDAPNRYRVLEALFEGIAKGLKALLNVKDGYHQEGIYFDALRPDRVYIHLEKQVVGTTLIPIPKIDGFGESFLFYGDAPHASMYYRLSNGMQQWKENRSLRSSPHAYEHFLPSSARGCVEGQNSPSPHRVLFQLGALLHHVIGKQPVRGSFPPLSALDTTLDPHWDQIADLCLAPPETHDPQTIDQVIALFGQISAKRTQLTPRERDLRKLETPEGMALIAISGKVELGAKDGPLTEQPRFRAKINPFFIDLHPVTVEEFQQFMPSYQASCYSRTPHSPATLISMGMALAYCKWRSEQEGLPSDTYRLPSEYEWEAAARGSSGELYPWGAAMNEERLRCGRDADSGAVDIHFYPPGRFGLFNMLGNVWEWTASRFKPHPFSTHKEKGYNAKLFVMKGGCWLTPYESCRASLRGALGPHEKRATIGFRCVRDTGIKPS